MAFLFTTRTSFDGSAPERSAPVDVLVEGDRIREVASKITAPGAQMIDLKGRTLMRASSTPMSTPSPALPISAPMRSCRTAS